MIKKVTSFLSHVTGEGERISFTYSEINEAGKIVKENQREDVVPQEDEILTAIRTIKEYLEKNLTTEGE